MWSCKVWRWSFPFRRDLQGIDVSSRCALAPERPERLGTARQAEWRHDCDESVSRLEARRPHDVCPWETRVTFPFPGRVLRGANASCVRTSSGPSPSGPGATEVLTFWGGGTVTESPRCRSANEESGGCGDACEEGGGTETRRRSRPGPDRLDSSPLLASWGRGRSSRRRLGLSSRRGVGAGGLLGPVGAFRGGGEGPLSRALRPGIFEGR